MGMTFGEQVNPEPDAEVKTLRHLVAELQLELAERKRAEEVLDQFFNHSLDMLCIADFAGYFKRVNPAWERTLGFTADDLCRRPFLDFVHPDDREATIAEVKQLSEGANTISFE